MQAIPRTQHAVQLVGPDQLKLNRSKPVPEPGPHELLLKVEAVGLCFSDLKLLKQFDQHVRKSEIVAGIDQEILNGLRSYVPGDKPVVPGHEVVCEIVAIGDRVQRHHVGERCLVQTDYRQLPTAGSCAAFGYNLEGGLQEYVLVDERVVIDPEGERFLIPVGQERSASAVALVEPWACVEDSYVNRERQSIKAGGNLLIVAEQGATTGGVENAYAPDGPPGEVVRITPAELTPRMYSTSMRLMGCRYAMMASASKAGPERREGLGTVSNRSRYGANSGRVISWRPPATSRSSKALSDSS